MMGKVSILIPCYNVEQYLPQCLDSIINQTYHDLQIVLVDDGSSDNTLAVAQQYAAKDSRIEVYHQENEGVAEARNVLLSKIKGDYFLFVDSDDWIENDMVEYLLSQALTYKAEMVTCDCVINDTPVSNGQIETTYNQEKTIERFLYHKEFRGMLWNKLMATSILGDSKFCNDISYGEDALFCWNVLQRVNTVVFTTKQLYHYRMNQSGISFGKFGPKKLSGHKVWTAICADVERKWPDFLDVAHARFCIESTLLLRDAAHCDYRQMDEVRLLQDTVKKYWNCLNKVNITSIKMKMYAYLACRSYWLASII